MVSGIPWGGFAIIKIVSNLLFRSVHWFVRHDMSHVLVDATFRGVSAPPTPTVGVGNHSGRQ